MSDHPEIRERPAPSPTDEERDVWVAEPESLSVRKLNGIVRRLREEVARARSEGRREGYAAARADAVAWHTEQARRCDAAEDHGLAHEMGADFHARCADALRALADEGKDGG